MGETLVGNKPGRALSFSATANGAQPGVQLNSLPSKRVGLFSPSDISNVIVRSDSNGEDLEAFAGAGKFSVTPCKFSLKRLLMKCTLGSWPDISILLFSPWHLIQLRNNQCWGSQPVSFKANVAEDYCFLAVKHTFEAWWPQHWPSAQCVSWCAGESREIQEQPQGLWDSAIYWKKLVKEIWNGIKFP